ncbi:hypothetical protein C0995_007600 [Termitomyces sp. Mi166|nr:hypothetical protein C0995_007600 [Termitomyces sp. Mi166\
MLRKFTTAQQNYAVHKLETLVILEALLKWEDKLMGYKIHIITDHKALEFFKTQTQRAKICPYIDSTKLRKREWKYELCKLRNYAPSKQLKEQKELCNLEAQQMVEATKTPNKGIELSSHNDDPLLAQVLKKRTELLTTDNDPAVAQVLATGTKVPVNSEHGEVQMRAHILQGYKKDQMYVEILDKPTEHSQFIIEWKLIYTVNTEGAKVLCVPRDRSLITTILDQAHNIVGHFGYQKTLEYVHQTYWWPQMAKDTVHSAEHVKHVNIRKLQTRNQQGSYTRFQYH